MSNRERRGSSYEQTKNLYSKALGMQTKIGLDIKRDVYRRLSDDGELINNNNNNNEKSTVAETYFTFLKSFIGIGVLALPFGFLLAGTIIGILLILIASFASWYCITLLLAARDTVEEQIKDGTINPNVLPKGELFSLCKNGIYISAH